MCTAVRAFGNSIVDFATRCCGLPSRPSESDIRLQQICIEHLRNNQISEALSNARNIKHHYIADQTYSQIVNQSLAHPKIHEAAFQIIDYTIRDEALMAVIELNLGQKNFEKAFDLISNLSDVFKTDEFYSQIALANRLDPIGKKAALAINDPTTGEKILSVLIRAHLFNGQLITPLDLLPLINKSADAETLLKKIQSVLLNFPVHLLDNPMIEALKEAGENCSFKLQLELFETLKQKHHSHIELSSKLQQVISEIKEKAAIPAREIATH